jgi:hypothetical protein
MSKERKSAVETAREAWGDPLPDWIEALAQCCDEHRSQRAAGQVIGYTSGAVNQVLKKKWRGSLANVEAKVRGALLGETVNCPVQGVITKDQCLKNQSLPFAATNSQRVHLYRACRNGCEHAK